MWQTIMEHDGEVPYVCNLSYRRMDLGREFSKIIERDQSTHSKGSMKSKLHKYNENHIEHSLANC